MHARRDADPARFGQAFQSGGNVDTVAKDVAVLDDDVALVDADAEFDPASGRQQRVAFRQSRLHFSRTADRIDDAGKLDQQAVTGGLDDAAFMARDLRVDHLRPQRLQPAKGAFLVGLDQP